MPKFKDGDHEAAAVLTIFDAGNMSKKGRRDVAKWIRQMADDLEKLGDKYASTMRCRYLVKRSK